MPLPPVINGLGQVASRVPWISGSWVQAGGNTSPGNPVNSAYTFWQGDPEWNTLTFMTEGGSGASGSFLLQGLADGGLSGGSTGLWPNLLVYRTNSNGSAFLGQVGGGSGAITISVGSVQPQLFQANITGLSSLRILVVSNAITGPVKFTWVLSAGPTSLFNLNPSILNSAGVMGADTASSMGWANNLNSNSAGAVTLYLASGAGTSAAGFQAVRIPQIFKTVSVSAATSGNSAVWTPAAGKKFRLMRFQITGSNLAATAATAVTLAFQDSASAVNTGTYDTLLPAVANVVSGVSDISQGWVDLGNGVLSGVANNVLNLNVSSAPSGAQGTYRVNVCGTEE